MDRREYIILHCINACMIYIHEDTVHHDTVDLLFLPDFPVNSVAHTGMYIIIILRILQLYYLSSSNYSL
jgi:hypothetical protein